MAGNFENLKFGPEEFRLSHFLYKKTEVSEKIRIRDHWGGIRVTTYRAIKFSLNFRHIDDVVNVSVGQDQQL